MKNLLFIISAFAVSLSASAVVNPNDTVIVEKPDMVTIVTSDSLQSIHVQGKKDNPGFTYQSKIELTDSNYVSESGINSNDFTFRFGMPKLEKEVNHSREITGTMNAYVGFSSAPGLPRPGELQRGKSGEFWLVLMNLHYSPWKSGNNTFSIGFGIDWRSYTLTRANRFVKSDGQISYGEFDEGVRPKESRLSVFSLTIPLLYNVTNGNGRSMFSIGPVFNFNTHSSISTKWKEDGKDVKDKQTNVFVRPFSVDLLISGRTVWGGVYLKYSPSSILKADHGLKFHSLTLGLYL